jgi:hypothetical protein
MAPRLEDGDIVVVHPQPQAETGQIVVARVSFRRRTVRARSARVKGVSDPGFAVALYKARAAVNRQSGGASEALVTE